jgi:hypothetical protein
MFYPVLPTFKIFLLSWPQNRPLGKKISTAKGKPQISTLNIKNAATKHME